MDATPRRAMVLEYLCKCRTDSWSKQRLSVAFNYLKHHGTRSRCVSCPKTAASERFAKVTREFGSRAWC